MTFQAKWSSPAGCAALALCLAGTLSAQSPTQNADSAASTVLPLVGTWQAEGDGFSTRLSYEWLMPGRLLVARNEVHGATGALIARYAGFYVLDPVNNRWDVRVVAESGELHRGVARWQAGILWQEAEVVGGSIGGYASAIRVEGDTMRYWARYSSGSADSILLSGEPIVYRRAMRPQ